MLIPRFTVSLVLIAFAACSFAGSFVVRVVSVADGDTVTVLTDTKEQVLSD